MDGIVPTTVNTKMLIITIIINIFLVQKCV